VNTTALAFGFWHPGDFSRSYRQQFGESPSETLARSRRGWWPPAAHRLQQASQPGAV